MFGWETPKTSKCLGAIVVVICSLITIGFLLPLDEYYLSSYIPSALTFNATFYARSALTKLFDRSAVAPTTDALKRFEFELTALTSLVATQLLVLDRVLLVCIDDSQRCTVSSLLKNNRTNRFLFGIFAENIAAVQRTAQILADNWTVNVYSNKHYLFKYSSSEFLFVSVEKRPNYWYIHGLSALRLDAFAIIPPKTLMPYSLVNKSDLILPWPLNENIAKLNRSRFLSCNTNVSKRLHENYPGRYSKQIIDDSAIEKLYYMQNTLLELNIVPFLFGGTLLGWYRECGLIPDTTDLDLSALASEYNPALETTLRKDKILKLYWILGKPSDSLEYSVYVGGVKIDLFFLYQTETNSWVGGMIVGKKAKLRWTYPKLEEVCSAELKGYLFHVPCNVEQFLTADYGPKWYEPFKDANFVWYKSHKNVQDVGSWSNAEWPRVYRPFMKI